MLKYLAIFLMSALSCSPAKLSSDTMLVDTGEEVEDRSWVTWDECGQDIGQNPSVRILATLLY